MASDKTRKKPARPGPTPGADYGAWLAMVPAESRERVAKLIRKHDVSDYAGLVKLIQDILAELLMGNVTPEVSKEARMWVELMFTVQATANSAQGTPESTQQNVVLALVQALDTVNQVQPKYTERERVFLDAENE